ncbi:MAG: ABC transporter substrate-binding protein [Rhodospirillaceae bacterium]|nr:ABC transporter substrate-binding protein [Rhodospirillaceae bacterium]
MHMTRRAMLVGAFVGVVASSAAAKPRVMSLDMCTDQLVLALADPEQITSVTPTAFSPTASVFAGRAKAYGVPVNGRTAEEAVAQKPDVVFIGGMWSGRTQRTLKQLGQTVVTFPMVNSVDDAIAQVRRAGEVLEQSVAASRIIAEIKAAQNRVPGNVSPQSPVTVLYLPGGYSFGDRTLVSDLLRMAGIRNVLADAGRVGMTSIDLEHLVLMRPDFVTINEAPANGAPRQATVLLHHPALKRAAPEAKTFVFPSRLWLCGGAQTATALDYLLAQSRAVP